MDFVYKEGGIYLEDKQGNCMGEITYRHSGDDLIIVDHTRVDTSLRGQGLAKQLLDKVVEIARDNNKKIVPLCSYVKVELNKDEQYKDILAK